MADAKSYIVTVLPDGECITEGEITYCWTCRHWQRNDGTFPDFDEKEWHKCELFNMVMPQYHYCGCGFPIPTGEE